MPGVNGGSCRTWYFPRVTRVSTNPIPAACTSIRTASSSGRGGIGISSTHNPGGPIRSWARSARIVAVMSGERGQAGDVPADDQ